MSIASVLEMHALALDSGFQETAEVVAEVGNTACRYLQHVEVEAVRNFRR